MSSKEQDKIGIPEQANVRLFLIDKILGNHFVDDPGIMFRARVLVSSWVLFIASLFLFSALLLVLPMKAEAKYSGFSLSGAIIFLLALMIFQFKRSGNFKRYARLSISIAFVGVAISVFLSESPITSPGIGLFYVVPLLAVFYLGRNAGVKWLLATLSLLITFFVLELFEFPFIALYDEHFLLETKLSAMLLGMVGVLGMVFAYELSNIKLREQRDNEFLRLEFLANHDALTKLSNRNKFESDIENAIARLGLNEFAQKLALFYIDLDGFKPVNDRYGHEAGDEVLRQVAERISLLVEGKGFAARHGGDEFILLLENVKQDQDALDFGKDLIREISQEITHLSETFSVGASIGVSMFPRDAQDIVTLIRNADIAMYHAKKHKQDICFYKDLP